MGESVTFSVIGKPHPQGSKSAFVVGKRAVVVDGTSKSGREAHKVWRTLVAEAAQIAAEDRGAPFTGPVAVHIEFRLPSVKSDPYRVLHVTKPDIDKLIRSCLDSMVDAKLLVDDSLVYSIGAVKMYAVGLAAVGATIVIEDMTFLGTMERETLKAVAKDRQRQAKARRALLREI